MKKRGTALALALLLCTGLAIPAHAEDPGLSVEDGVRPIQYHMEDRNGNAVSYPTMDNEIYIGTYYWMPGITDISTQQKYVTVPKDVVFSVTNTGGLHDCYIQIAVQPHKAMTKAEMMADDDLRLGLESEDYVSTISPDSLSDQDTIFFKDDYGWLGDYLGTDGQWGVDPYEEPENRVMLQEGESHRFTLPDPQEGKVYQLFFEVKYPELSETYSYWKWLYLRIDSNATPEMPGVSGFSDVTSKDYFAQPVAWAVSNNITSGTSASTFGPSDTCTTAHILTFLWRANGSPEPTIANPFDDVSDSDYFAKPAIWAHEKGLVSGSSLQGGAPALRDAVVTYLWKLAGQPDPQGSNPFTDVTGDTRAVVWAKEQGITGGTSDTTFSPKDTCTRGQIVTFLYAALAD